MQLPQRFLRQFFFITLLLFCLMLAYNIRGDFMQMIAISCGHQADNCLIRRYYVDMVRDFGAYPVILAPGAPLGLPAAIDGLILSGGGDVAADFCGLPADRLRQTDCERDRFELAAVWAALTRGLPILGICRGMQVLNLALGGSLVADLPDHNHWQQWEPERVWHQVEFTDSGWRQFLGVGTLDVNSLHHQAVDRVAPGLRVFARAADGVVEGIWDRDKNIVGVQWHPERLYERHLLQYAWLERWFDASRKKNADSE